MLISDIHVSPVTRECSNEHTKKIYIFCSFILLSKWRGWGRIVKKKTYSSISTNQNPSKRVSTTSSIKNINGRERYLFLKPFLLLYVDNKDNRHTFYGIQNANPITIWQSVHLLLFFLFFFSKKKKWESPNTPYSCPLIDAPHPCANDISIKEQTAAKTK